MDKFELMLVALLTFPPAFFPLGIIKKSKRRISAQT